MKKIRLSYFTAVFLLALLLSGCTTPSTNDPFDQPLSRTEFYFDTAVTVTLYDSDDDAILDHCFEMCADYELMFSRTKPESELYQLNEQGSYTVSDETLSLIQSGLQYCTLSDGAFDIAIAPLTSLWDFSADAPQLPEDSRIREALPHVDYTKVQINGNQVQFQESGMGIDLGAIAKGYMADQIKSYLLEAGVHSAVIDLGGNVLCVGSKPDGTPFRIGIQKPFENRNETIAIAQITDRSVVSSGVYERHFVLDGVNYHHILDPHTGYPYENGLTAVTIISDRSIDGDGLSTTCMSLGLEKGLALINSLDDIYALFITEDGALHYSDGFKDAVSIQETSD